MYLQAPARAEYDRKEMKNMSVKVKIDTRKIESAIKNKTVETLNNRSYEVECPHCNAKISAHPGQNICPFCHNTVDLNLNIKF